jgi:hypothetical protein
LVLGGWVYTLGVNGQRLSALEEDVIDTRARVEVLQGLGATRTVELVRLSQAVENLEETIRELRIDLRETRR